MINKIKLVILGLMFSVSASAGFFSTEPPATFQDLAVMAGYGTTSYLYSFTVGDYVNAYKADSETKWEKDGDGWILHVVKPDKMAGTKSKIAIRLQEIKGKGALVSRMVVDGENLSAGMIVNLMSQLDGAIGKPAKKTK